MPPTRTPGKSALWKNRQDPAFGRGEKTRHRALDRKHPQSPVLKLKLPARLKITGPPKKQGLKLRSRTAKTRPIPPRRKINLKRNRRVRSADRRASLPDARRLAASTIIPAFLDS